MVHRLRCQTHQTSEFGVLQARGISVSLLQFCKTERQKAVISRVENGKSQREIAKELKISRSTVVNHLETVKLSAAKKGYSPEHDYVHAVPDGFSVKGVSTYYDSDGKPTGQWVKSQSDEQRQLQLLVERMEQSLDAVPPFKPTKPPKQTDDRLLSLLTITDFHVGSACWEAETGDNFDTKHTPVSYTHLTLPTNREV